MQRLLSVVAGMHRNIMGVIVDAPFVRGPNAILEGLHVDIPPRRVVMLGELSKLRRVDARTCDAFAAGRPIAHCSNQRALLSMCEALMSWPAYKARMNGTHAATR